MNLVYKKLRENNSVFTWLIQKYSTWKEFEYGGLQIPIKIVRHCAKKWFQCIYLDSSAVRVTD